MGYGLASIIWVDMQELGQILEGYLKKFLQVLRKNGD